MTKIKNYEGKKANCIDILGNEISPGDICTISSSECIQLLICSHMAQSTLVFEPLFRGNRIDLPDSKNPYSNYKRQVRYRDLKWKVLKITKEFKLKEN